MKELERVSLMFGKRCIRFALPGLSPDGRQWLELEFEDGTKLCGWGKTGGEALAHLLARSRIKAVEKPQEPLSGGGGTQA